MTGFGYFDLDEHGLPGRRNCPACAAPLEPGFIDESTGLVWMCPNHGMVAHMPRPLEEG